MKVQIKGFITMSQPCEWQETPSFNFFCCRMDEHGHATIQPHVIEVELVDFDPRAKQVESLQAAKVKAMADFQNRMTEIDRQISELTAIECVGAA